MSNTDLLADRIRSLFGLAARPQQSEQLEIRALADGGGHVEALRRLEQLCRDRPSEAHFHLLRGQLCLAAERWQDAVDAIGRSVSIDASDPLVRRWHVLASRDAGQHAEATAAAKGLSIALESSSVRVRMQDEEITAQEIQ